MLKILCLYLIKGGIFVKLVYSDCFLEKGQMLTESVSINLGCHVKYERRIGLF